MKYSIPFLLFIFIFSHHATAEQQYYGKIIDYGILKVEKEIRNHTASGSADHVTEVLYKNVSNTTNIIPLKKGLTFGYVFKILPNTKSETIEIYVIGIHPAMKKQSHSKIETSYKYKDSIQLGKERYAGYTFNEDYEMVEGDWKIQIWFNERMLCEKSFKVVKN